MDRAPAPDQTYSMMMMMMMMMMLIIMLISISPPPHDDRCWQNLPDTPAIAIFSPLSPNPNWLFLARALALWDGISKISSL